MKKISAEIVADSICNGHRITTMLLTVPQIVVKELLRHRMFSFSSSSMRAIPFKKVIQDVRDNMFVPLAFQKHHSGMQGAEYLSGEKAEEAKCQWIEAGLKACDEAERLYNLGVTKQLCSRIIEPFGYAKILITATEFENFFELRVPKYKLIGLGGEPVKSRKDWLEKMQFSSVLHPFQYPKTEEGWWILSKSSAEIHIQALAESVWDAMNESTPRQLEAGMWHYPFHENMPFKVSWEDAVKISVARAARLSYMTFDGEIDYEKDIKLHDQLLESKHASPMEHCAIAKGDGLFYANFNSWQSYRNLLEL